MSKSTSRIWTVGTAVSAAALALALLTGSALGYGGIDLERNCAQPDAGFAQAQCSFNVATPSGWQGVDQNADNTNTFKPEQDLYQKQVNEQDLFAPTYQSSEIRDVEGGDATVEVKSGSVTTMGHSLDLNLGHTMQMATASPQGLIFQNGKSGDAYAKASGDVKSEGGDASAYQKSVSVIDAYASLFAPGAEVGGSGGDTGRASGGDIRGNEVSGGNGGWNVAVGLQGAGGLAASGDVRRNSESEAEATAKAEMQQNLTGGAGGGASMGPNTAGAATSGAGGAGGTGTFNPNVSQLTGNPVVTSSGTANAGDARSAAYGHVVGGGQTSGGVVNSASMNGGMAVNELGLSIAQSGNQSGTSGAVTNNGSASAPVDIYVEQSDASNLSQAQNPAFTGGSATANAGGQTATSGQTATPTQNVSSGAQMAKGENKVELGVKIEDSFQVNDNDVRVRFPFGL